MIQGVAFSGLGCFEKSATVLTRLSVLKPDSPCAISLLAAALINCQRYQEGLTQAVRAVELGPEDPSAWVLKGLALTRLDRDSDALACFEQASSLGLKSPAVLLMRAQLLFVLARWREGAERLDSALLQYSRLSEPDAGDTGAILRNLIATSNNATILRLCIKVLVHVYGRHKLLAPLAYGLLDCIPDITSPGCIDTAAKKWLRSWQAVAGALPEFRFPLRLLESAVRYRRTSDSRILMELSREERKLLQILAGLQIDEGLLLFESHEDGVALTNP
jgi:tetratricopeptide (TPR) repeat protein